MKTVTYVESKVLETKLGYTDENGIFVEIDCVSEEEATPIAKKLDISPQLLLALTDIFACLRLALHEDLTSIWSRLDTLSHNKK